MHAAVIVNPHARALRGTPGLSQRLTDLARGRAEVCTTRDTADLDATARRFADAGITHLGVVGGDGTASTTLSAIARAYGEASLPSITLLRGGTMNTVANALGVPRGTPASLMCAALEAWADPARAVSRLRPALRIGRDRLGFLFGTGVMYGYLAEYYAVGRGRPTPVTAARVFASAVASALVDGDTYKRIRNAAPLGVRFADGSWETRTYMTVCAGTVNQVGLGFRPFHKAHGAPDRFQLIAIKGPPMLVARDLPNIRLGLGLRPDAAHDTLTEWAEIRPEQGGFGYFVDGDLYQSDGPLELRVGPTFRFFLAQDEARI